MIRKRLEMLLAASAIGYGAYNLIEQRFGEGNTSVLEYVAPIGDLNSDGKEDMRFFTDKGPAFDLVSKIGKDGLLTYEPTGLHMYADDSWKIEDGKWKRAD